LAIHNIKDLGSTRINPDPIPFAIAGFNSSPVAVTFNPHALFRKTMNPIAVPKNLEDLLKLDSTKRLSDLGNPAPTQPPTATPAISTRSKPAPPGPETDPQVNEGSQESDKDSPTIPWKTDFVPRQACLLPPTMFDIVTDIPSDPKKLFLALRTRVKSLAFGTRNNHEDSSSSNDDSSTNSDSSNQSTIPTAHNLATYTYTLQYAFCLARGHLEGASIEPCTSGLHDRRLKEMTRLCLDLTGPLNPGTAGDLPSRITNPASIDFSGLQSSLDKLASSSSSKKPGFDRLSPKKKKHAPPSELNRQGLPSSPYHKRPT
jgi:hypothetical protein